MSKLAVVLLFAAYLSVDFTSGSSIYRQTEDESSMHSQQDDGDRRSTSNLDKYDEKSDDQESKDSLMTRFVNNMADRVDTAHKLWNEAQRDSSQGKDYSDAVSSFRTEADPESDEAKKSTLVGSFLEGLKASASHARSYMNNEETGKDKETNEDEASSSPYLSSEKLPYLAKNMQNGFKRAMKSYLGTDDIFSYYVKRQESNPART